MNTIFNDNAFEAEYMEKKNEMNVIAELIQKCVNENARAKLEQEEYKSRYEGLASRFEEAKKDSMKLVI